MCWGVVRRGISRRVRIVLGGIQERAREWRRWFVRRFAQLSEWGRLGAHKTRSFLRKLLRRLFPEVSLATSLLALIVGGVLTMLGRQDWRSMAAGIVVILGTIANIGWHLVTKRKQTAVMALTAKYLLSREAGNIDEMLGSLISERQDWTEIHPEDEFFKTLEEVCRGGQYELKRRVAEALPALFSLDLEHAEDLIRILRTDWHEQKWRSDNRRRTVEALPHIIDRDIDFVFDMVQHTTGDEIYTTIASVEVLHECERRSPKRARGAYRALHNAVEGSAKPDETAAIDLLWEFLHTVQTDRRKALRDCDGLVDHSNPYVQMCMARNIRRLCSCYPSCRRNGMCRGDPVAILRLVGCILEKKGNHNARRPIAKGGSLDCLVNLLRTPHSSQARNMILSLVDDPDKIIRITVFDKIERLRRQDQQLGGLILDRILARNDDPELRDRALRLKQRSGQPAS